MLKKSKFAKLSCYTSGMCMLWHSPSLLTSNLFLELVLATQAAHMLLSYSPTSSD